MKFSEEMLGADKENTPDPSIAVPMPKKRAKDTTTVRAPHPSTVLSPKSSNSRTLPQSPIRPPFGSPGKVQMPLHPQSPLKPVSPMKAAAAAATVGLANMVNSKSAKPAIGSTAGTSAAITRKTSKQAAAPKPAATRPKRGVAPVAAPTTQKRTVSASSNASGTSTGTTIVKRVGKALAATTTGKRAAAAAAAKKVVAPKTKTEAAKAEQPTTGRRVLRKRA